MLKTFLIKIASLQLTDNRDVNDSIYHKYFELVCKEVIKYAMYETNRKDDIRSSSANVVYITNMRIEHSYIEFTALLCIECDVYTSHMLEKSHYSSKVSYNGYYKRYGNAISYKTRDVRIHICIDCLMMYYSTYQLDDEADHKLAQIIVMN
jgi:hypothetical protein